MWRGRILASSCSVSSFPASFASHYPSPPPFLRVLLLLILIPFSYSLPPYPLPMVLLLISPRVFFLTPPLPFDHLPRIFTHWSPVAWPRLCSQGGAPGGGLSAETHPRSLFFKRARYGIACRVARGACGPRRPVPNAPTLDGFTRFVLASAAMVPEGFFQRRLPPNRRTRTSC